MKTIPRADPDWLAKTLSHLRYDGIAIIESVLDSETIEEAIAAARLAQAAIEADVGQSTLQRAREAGHCELRLPMKYEPFFMELLANPDALAVIDATLSSTAIIRFQNLEILPPHREDDLPLIQTEFHMNTQRVMSGYVGSLDVVFPFTAVRPDEEDFLVVPKTHQRSEPPDADYLQWNRVPVGCEPGAMIVFDSTLWHREGKNGSNEERVFITQQYIRSFMKPHFDHVRALGDECLMSLPERTRQLLGWYTRLPTSLQEFYLPADQRLYRGGQG